MTLREMLLGARTQFQAHAIDAPQLSAEYLALAAIERSRAAIERSSAAIERGPTTAGLGPAAAGWNRAALRGDLDREVQPDVIATFDDFVARRLRREPLQYIVGEWEFCGLRLFTTPAALIPRPETEILVQEALSELAAAGAVASHNRQSAADFRVLDIGTGTGAIAIAIAKAAARRDGQQISVLAIDISDEALALAERNAARHGLPMIGHGLPTTRVASRVAQAARVAQASRLRPSDDDQPTARVAARRGARPFADEQPPPQPIEFLKADILKEDLSAAARRGGPRRGLDGTIDLIVSNPPYVSADEWREIEQAEDSKELLFEPRIALTDGADGLRFYERILQLAKGWLKPDGRILLELGHEAHRHIARLAEANHIQPIRIVEDLAEIPRVFVGARGKKTGS